MWAKPEAARDFLNDLEGMLLVLPILGIAALGGVDSWDSPE
jgi:hypothetical protein